MDIIKRLTSHLKKPEFEVTQFLASAPLKYKVYTIPKRTSGHRVIAQPSKELKEYQRAFLSIYNFPVHDAAMAYKKGKSIKDNALTHSQNAYLLKLDLVNFFNSISNELFWRVWERNYNSLSQGDKHYMEKLLFWSPSKLSSGKLVLSVGAPSSPLISNFFMYQFDKTLSKGCLALGVKYTRYADDLTFSTKNKGMLFGIPSLVSVILQEQFDGGMLINRRKTVFSSKRHNRHVTGITIDNNDQLSLGREKKRYIKHLVHQYCLKKLTREDIPHLKGLLAFAKHIEPKFMITLQAKYSKSVITQIFEEENG